MRLFSRPEIAVLFVCTANICRSPMGAGVLRNELHQLGLHHRVKVDSAGTHATQPGRGADPRARKLCAIEGISLGRCRARQFKERDFIRFDYILAMDQRHEQWLLDRCQEDFRERISLLGNWGAGDGPVEVPDPFYGNLAGFEQVLTILRDSVSGFVAHLVDEHLGETH